MKFIKIFYQRFYEIKNDYNKLYLRSLGALILLQI